jgi:N6-adenosine-specific RNA methylase IME4
MTALATTDRLDAHLAALTNPADAAQLTRDFQALKTAAGNRVEANKALVLYGKAARRAGQLLGEIERSPGGRPQKNSSDRRTSFQQALGDCQIGHDTAHRWQGLARLDDATFAAWCARVEAGVDRASVGLPRPSDSPGTRVLTSLPAGVFRVIYADPPWRYEPGAPPNREVANHYYTLSLDELCALTDAEGRAISSLAAEDSILFMWATSPKLFEARDVIEAWGFEYRTCMVWVKDKIGMGWYARQRHELLLIAKRGEPPMPEQANRPDSVIEAPRTAHSVKPDLVYGLIESMFAGPYVELFARGERDGWAAWGTDVGTEAA